MAEAQIRLAAMLTSIDEPPAEDTRPFGERAISRSREVLKEKRVDAALPVLAHLAPHREALRPLARACLSRTQRSPAFASIADAIRVARAAAAEPRFAEAARLDLLVLRARFIGPSADGSVRPRSAPFAGRETLTTGRTVWALKGPGAAAPVKVIDPGDLYDAIRRRVLPAGDGERTSLLLLDRGQRRTPPHLHRAGGTRGADPRVPRAPR
jgi:hypothetical protein